VFALDPPYGCGIFVGFSRVLRWPGAAALGMEVVFVFFVGGGRPDWGCSWGSIDLMSSPNNELGSVAAVENRALTLVMADDGDVTRCYLLEGIVVTVYGFLLVLLREIS
jgi:hypothetical protein